MSIAPGWRGTNTIMREMEERLGKLERDPRYIVFGPPKNEIEDQEEQILLLIKSGTGLLNKKVMGQFKIEIVAVGGHGVDRSKKDGEVVNFDADGAFSPDAIAKAMVSHMQRAGVNIESATITHWPGQPSEVKDDLVTGKRTGNF